MPQNAADVVSTVVQKTTKNVITLFERDDMFYTKMDGVEGTIVSPVPVGSAAVAGRTLAQDRDVRVPLEITPGGITRGWDPDGGSMGSGSASKYTHATAPVIFTEHAVSWTEAVQMTTGSNEKAVAKVVRRNLASSMKEYRRNLESLCMVGSNGYVGEYASGAITGGKRVITLEDVGFGSRLIRPGMELQTYDVSAGNVVNTKMIVESVDGLEVTMDIGTAFTAAEADGDKLFLSGLKGDPPRSMYGIQYHHNNSSAGMWMGLDRGTYANIRSFGRAVNGAFNLAAARICMNQMMIRAGYKEEKVSKIQAWMHPAQKHAYEALGAQWAAGGQRFQTNMGGGNKKLNLYFDGGMLLAGAPVVASPNWHKQRVDFVDFSNWMRIEGGKIRYYGGDHGRTVFPERGSDGSIKSSWISYLVSQFNIFVKNPLCTAYIAGLTVPDGYAS